VRCSQCGYTTFDYLEACSKCQANFYEEKVRLNLHTGPFKPISLTEIVARFEASSPPTAETLPPEENTLKLKMKPSPSTGPKTFDLDLSDDRDIENLADKLLAKSGGIPGKKGGELPLDLSLE
jgi:hypothetical protein